MKKIKLLPSIIMLALCLAVLGIGVYSATTGSNTISGILTVNSAGHEVDIAVYEYTGNTSSAGSVRIDHSLATTSQMYGKLLGSATSRASSTISGINLAFNSDEANTFADVDMIDLVVAVTNKSSSDIGVYFWDGEGTKPTQVTESDLGNEGHVVYGHKSLNASDGLHNNIADAEYSFYHHIPGSTDSLIVGTAYGDYQDLDTTGNSTADIRYYTEFMHVYLRLKEAGFTSDTLTIALSMKLNVEKYEANATTVAEVSSSEGFTKIAKGVVPTGYSSNSSYVSLPYGIAQVRASAFSGNARVVAVSIPTSVTSVGNSAFNACSSLDSVVIASSVTSLGQYAFKSCSGLSSVVIPGSVSTLGYYIFQSCTNLSSVKLLYGVVSIANTFWSCTSLSLVKIPNSVTSISGSFYNCTSLTSIKIPDSVETISNDAFEKCTGLMSINIPRSVSNIVGNPFTECTNLVNILVDSENMTYDSRDNCNAIIISVSNELIVGCKNTTIPNTITSIGQKAFYKCNGLTSLFIPSSVTKIGQNAFGLCSGLAEISGMSNVLECYAVDFNNTAWYSAQEDGPMYLGCVCLGYKGTMPANTSIIIPSVIKCISNSAFNGKATLTSVYIPSSVKSIGSSAFSSCSGLTSIFIPSSVNSIYGDSLSFTPFKGDSSLVINCEVLEENKPAGWGTYWNYYNSTSTCTTNYGQTR